MPDCHINATEPRSTSQNAKKAKRGCETGRPRLDCGPRRKTGEHSSPCTAISTSEIAEREKSVCRAECNIVNLIS